MTLNAPTCVLIADRPDAPSYRLFGPHNRDSAEAPFRALLAARHVPQYYEPYWDGIGTTESAP